MFTETPSGTGVNVVDVIADVARMHYFVLLKKMYLDSGRFVFHDISLFKDRAVC